MNEFAGSYRAVLTLALPSPSPTILVGNNVTLIERGDT